MEVIRFIHQIIRVEHSQKSFFLVHTLLHLKLNIFGLSSQIWRQECIQNNIINIDNRHFSLIYSHISRHSPNKYNNLPKQKSNDGKTSLTQSLIYKYRLLKSVHKVSHTSYQRFAQSLAIMAEQTGIHLGMRMKNVKSPQILLYISLVERVCRPSIRCIRYLLDKELEEGVTQSVLNAVQGFVNITGSLQLRSAQEAFIKMICEFCLPKQGYTDFTKRHIQINKMVLNIGNCLGSIQYLLYKKLDLLECSCWITILKTFQECENFYQRNRLARDGSQEEQIKSQDILILFASLDQLFTHSKSYNNEHLLLIMDAINQITIEQLESNQFENLSPKGPKKFESSKPKVFSLIKLLELVRSNLHRMDLFWELIMAHFICVVSSRNIIMVHNTADTLCQIIFMGFEFMLQYYQKESNRDNSVQQENQQSELDGQNFMKEKWAAKDGAYQHTLLQPLVDLCALRSSELKETILQAVLKVLQNNGHELKVLGWSQVLEIMRQISGEQTHLYVKSGLTATECIINQFLGGLSVNQTEQLFEVIENFKQNSSESNINFQICNMLWHIGDYLNKSNKEKQDQFMGKIFNRLSGISQDSVPEIRHSAIHIFTNLILHLNSENNNWEDQKRILDQVFLLMTEKIILQFQDKRIGNEQDSSQWEETAKSIMQSALKILKRYFQILDEKNDQETASNEISSILKSFLPHLILAMKQQRGDLLLECFKIAKELIQTKPREHFNIDGEFIELLSFIQRLFTSPPHDIKLLKVIILKVIPEVLVFLETAFKTCVHYQNNTQIITILFAIHSKILSYPLIADMTFNLISNKIFYDETNAVYLFKVFNPLITHFTQETYILLIEIITTHLQPQPSTKSQHSLMIKLLRQLDDLLSQSDWLEEPYFQILELIAQTARLLRVNNAYINFHIALGGQSIWAQAAFTLLNIAKNNKIESQKLRLIGILSSLIPNTTHYMNDQTNLNDSILYLNENIQVQNQYIQYITEQYLINQELVDNTTFYQSLYELSTIKSANAHLIGEIPILTLFKLQTCPLGPQSLPYLIAASQKLLEMNQVPPYKINETTPKLLFLLLEQLKDSVIPKNSFLEFKPLQAEQPKCFDINSPLQKEKGHLCYLLPQIILQVQSNDLDVRKIIQVILQQISDQLLM